MTTLPWCFVMSIICVFFRWTAQTGTYLEPNRAAFRVPVARTKPGYLSTILSRMSIQYSVAYIGVVHPNLVGALEHVLFSISHIYIYGMSSFQGLGSVQPLDGVRFCRAVTVCHSLSGATELVPRVYTVIANIAATLCSARPGPYLSCPIHCRSID